MVESIALYLAGLSFFFTGMAGISDNLRQMTGQRFRILLVRATNHPARAGMLGMIAGMFTQSTSVVAFILSGMISAGLMPIRRALIVLACANIGTAALVFIAAVDFHLPILFLIGVCGLIIAFNLLVRWKPWVACVLSIGLVFFGLDMMKQAFRPVSASQGMAAIANFFDYWPDAAFFLGTLMRTFIHSSAASAAITITINRNGIFNEFPAMMSMAGLGMGTAIATWFLSSNLHGVPRQIAYFQMMGNVAAGLIVAALLVVEHSTDIPLILAMLNTFSQSISGRMALMYLFFNVVIAALSIASLRWAPAWLARLSPSTPEEDLSRPIYLQPDALLSPENAPDLVALEQMRVMRALGDYLEIARGAAHFNLDALHNASVLLGHETKHFLDALVQQPLGTALAARLIAFQRKEGILRALEENVFQFAHSLQGRGGEDLPGRLVEALDTILLTASDALSSRDAVDIDLLIGMTDDRGGVMERLRNEYGVQHPAQAREIAVLHYATTLFERNVWLIRQLALWIREDLRLNEV
ncbi:MAG TPA: Na/Pi symporter [Terracidiphilus sp.]|nr:Na/Pi symporter [Terracidiphilus sp.]